MKFCPECGKPLQSESVKYCPECGYRLVIAETPAQTSDSPAPLAPSSEVSSAPEAAASDTASQPPSSARLCPNCGAELAPAVTQFCPNCSFKLLPAFDSPVAPLGHSRGATEEFVDESLYWVYLAGNPTYGGGITTKLDLKNDGLALTGLSPPLLVPYGDIEGFEMIPSKQITTTRTFLIGPLLASSWKKIEWFLCIRYRDDAGIMLSMVFMPLSPITLEAFMPALYEKMREARTKHSS